VLAELRSVDGLKRGVAREPVMSGETLHRGAR
jgi:hypothetical protein